MPSHEFRPYRFPRGAYMKKPKRAFKVLGEVKSRQDYNFLNPDVSDTRLCKANFNRAVGKLLRYAKRHGGDAVINVRSVVFLLDGSVELHKRAECADEGAEGQVLARGLVVKWLPAPKTRKSKK